MSGIEAARQRAETLALEFAKQLSALPYFSAAVVAITLEDEEAYDGHTAVTGEPAPLTRTLAAILDNVESVDANAGVVDDALAMMGDNIARFDRAFGADDSDDYEN